MAIYNITLKARNNIQLFLKINSYTVYLARIEVRFLYESAIFPIRSNEKKNKNII